MVYPYSESPEAKLGLDQKKQSGLAANSPKSSPVGSPPSSISMSPPKSPAILSPDTTSAAQTTISSTSMLVEPKKVSRSIIDESVFNFDDFPPNSASEPSTSAAHPDNLSNRNLAEQPSSPTRSTYDSMSPSTMSPRDSLNFERLSLVRKNILKKFGSATRSRTF